MTRVLIAVHYFPPHLGGVEQVAYNQAQYLQGSGASEVRVLTSAVGIVSEDQGGKEKLTVIRVGAANIAERRFGIPFPIFNPSIIWKSFRLVRWADIVHAHDSLYVSSWLVALWCRILGVPLVVTQHVDLVAHPSPLVRAVQRVVYATIGGITLRTARRIVVLNTRTAEFVQSTGVPSSRLVLLPNGVDSDLFKPASPERKMSLRRELGLPAERVLVLFVGRFVSKKGIAHLAEATSSKYSLVLAGGSRPKQSVGLGDRSLSSDFISLGRLPASAMPALYQACDIFVLPSESEGFPLALQEAMASGLPIVTSDDPSYLAYRMDPERVSFVPPNSTSIREALESLVDDEDRRIQMASYSRRFAVANFSWRRHVEWLQNEYGNFLPIQHASERRRGDDSSPVYSPINGADQDGPRPVTGGRP